MVSDHMPERCVLVGCAGRIIYTHKHTNCCKKGPVCPRTPAREVSDLQHEQGHAATVVSNSLEPPLVLLVRIAFGYPPPNNKNFWFCFVIRKLLDKSQKA